MKPIIGITVECRREANGRSGGSLTLNWNYAQRIAEAGGVPLLVPPQADAAEIAALIDGWLIPGGDDIDAARFGQENHPKAVLQDPARFEVELALYAALPEGVPILGICYGCQFLNVVRGGDLVQHLPDVVGHENHSGGTRAVHRIEPGSVLSRALGSEQAVGLSYHHQACGRIGAGMRVVSRDDGGTVEAIEATDRPWMIGVQWHPERLPEDREVRRLFEAFVAAAAGRRASKAVEAAAP